MALRLEKITKDFNDINKLKRLFIKAFPKNERLPLWFLLMKADKDFVDFIGFYDEDDFIGFTYLITNKDLIFVLYLAIDSSQRSKGYGGAVLSKIKELYPNNRLILNIEAIISNSQNYEQRVKRKNFYIKMGTSILESC
ncbi:GNAT family N-acetyltransferase [Oceanobacillus kimchii]|uniref:GNAT family N-acetyltransferase n=1 Tax=Oceanobacillus kimchii TaxID=746691 RepID=UPI0021A287DD|nr:GNAT family N-acetyltransferase [Oceanobacillus kimchii]MCT1578740.1 GNAT family N-acetyltransferase [Oceanobacillus kimchii]MCT2136211.1 GNAT family N-acetyltransferase [Oceanobacillus kimchii]